MHLPHNIGRYRLEKPLGSGAFGVVWMAHDDSLQAPVAIKVMADNWAQRLDLRERFLSEARLLRQAASPRVVQVHDIGELPDERPYFVMEYADGGTLEDLLADGPLPVDEALRLAAEAARAVAVLHEAGILHRDVKPSNMLIRSELGARRRRLLVADLGLAKSLAHASGLTMTAGSAGYMAPEQAEPGGGIDERADVYGLGALAYHLLTGSVPASPGKVVPPGRLRTGLPDRAERSIMRALQPDRARRWPSATAFADELGTVAEQIAEQPASSRAGGRTPRRPHHRSRERGRRLPEHRGRFLLGGAALVVTVLLAGWFAFDGTGRSSTALPASADRESTASLSGAPSPLASRSPRQGDATSAAPSASKSGRSVPPTPVGTKSPGSTGDAKPVRAEGSVPPASGSASRSAPAQWTTTCVQPNTKLLAGQAWSTNRTRMVMQTNGSLVIYDENDRSRWSSGTAGSGNEAYLQGDGNLVVFSRGGESLWHTGTQGHDGAILCLGADGNVNIVYQDQAIWSAGTGH